MCIQSSFYAGKNLRLLPEFFRSWRGVLVLNKDFSLKIRVNPLPAAVPSKLPERKPVRDKSMTGLFYYLILSIGYCANKTFERGRGKLLEKLSFESLNCVPVILDMRKKCSGILL